MEHHGAPFCTVVYYYVVPDTYHGAPWCTSSVENYCAPNCYNKSTVVIMVTIVCGAMIHYGVQYYGVTIMHHGITSGALLFTSLHQGITMIFHGVPTWYRVVIFPVECPSCNFIETYSAMLDKTFIQLPTSHSY